MTGHRLAVSTVMTVAPKTPAPATWAHTENVISTATGMTLPDKNNALQDIRPPYGGHGRLRPNGPVAVVNEGVRRAARAVRCLAVPATAGRRPGIGIPTGFATSEFSDVTPGR